MSLETGNFISDLDPDNPTANDPKSEGDDHLRLLKKTIQNTFPNIDGAVTASDEELNVLDGATASTAELNFVAGVTSSIQTQLGTKPTVNVTFLDIGDWDMDTFGSVSVAHGLDWTSIRTVEASIINDVSNMSWSFGGSSSAGTLHGEIRRDPANIVLVRTSAGAFDASAFSTTPFNRGYITIWHV